MNAIFQKYYPSLCYVASRITEDEAAAKDIVQEVFVKYWLTNGQETIRQPRAWLYTVTRRDAIRYRKDYIQQQTAIATSILPSWEEDSSLLIIAAETGRQLQDALEELPRQMRTIMQLHYIEEKSIREIASSMQLQISTVKTQKQRGLTHLRKIIGGLSMIMTIYFPYY